MTDAIDYGAIMKYVEAAMHDIETKKQVKVAKHDTVTRLAPKDKITEKLSDCGKRPQQSPDDLHPSDGYDSDKLHVDGEMHPDNVLSKWWQYFNNGQSGEYHFGGLYETTAEEKFFYG